jgi:protein-S-isoprenylcysteine O-methyltransferase Ste14
MTDMALVALYILWFVWLMIWTALSLRFRPAVARSTGWRHSVPFQLLWLCGIFLLLGFGSGSYDLKYRLWDIVDGAGGWYLVGLTAAGLLFAAWARIHLGRPIHGRAVVCSGPYALVRHPVYSGALFAAFATAVLQGIPTAFLGLALCLIGFVLKAQAEERYLRRELGRAYEAYAMQVPMLLPYPKLLWRTLRRLAK